MLPLTSMIDAFCIIVIYLLIGTQSGSLEVPTTDRIRLPQANASSALEKETPILRIENGIYFLNEKPISVNALGSALAELKSSSQANEILIQADQSMNYVELDPVLRAGSQAGIEKLKFAVIPSR